MSYVRQVPRYRAGCDECGWGGPLRVTLEGAESDRLYHDRISHPGEPS